MFEKSVTLIGNIVAIITFVLSVLNWFGLSVVLDASISNKRVAASALVVYAVLASFASAKTLLYQQQHSKRVGLLWFALTFSYVFGFLFLLDKSKAILQPEPLVENNIVNLAAACYGVTFYLLYIWPQWFPDGYSLIRHLFRPFAALGYGFLFLGNLGAVFLLFYLLRTVP